MERVEGYYWVKYKDSWAICEWNDEKWYWPGIITPFFDGNFTEIDESRIIRENE